MPLRDLLIVLVLWLAVMLLVWLLPYGRRADGNAGSCWVDAADVGL